MSSKDKPDWDDSLRRLAEADPEDWPAGLRTALRDSSPPAPTALDRRMAGLILAELAGKPGMAERPEAPSANSPSARPGTIPAGVLKLPLVRRPSFALAAAASVLIAVGLALIQFWPAQSELVVVRQRGEVRILRDGRTHPVGTYLRPGDELNLSDDSALELSFAGGVHLQIIGPARATFRPAGGQVAPLELDLTRGEVFFVSRDRAAARRFAFTTERARYELAGTAGLLTVKDEVESVWVVEGAVDLRYRGQEKILRVPEASYVLVDRESPDTPPEINPSDEHSFQIMCRRRDRLLKLVQSGGPAEKIQ